MKLRHFIIVFVAAFAGSFFLASCLNEDNKIPPNCFDGILNNGEQLIDCGGPCPACNHCIDGIWQPNLGETCIDCGGECGPCPQCRNCIQDGDESGIDCGGTFCGPCAALCNDGILNGNEQAIDCGGACEACPTCDDGLMNGNEIGIDCGGTLCPPCTTDGNCRNGLLDGDEFWVDCGGSHCPPCEPTMSWRAGTVNHTVLPANITKSFDGTTLTITGVSLQGGTMTIITNTPAAGWVSGATVTMNAASAPAKAMSFVNEFSIPYTTASGAVASGTLNIQRFVATPLPGIIRGTFSGNFYDAAGTVPVQISNGVFQVPFN